MSTRTKRKSATRKKPTAKQLTARRAFAAAARAGTLKKGSRLKKNPVHKPRSVSGKSAATRKAARGRKPASSLYTAKKKQTAKFYLVARVQDGDGYVFKYFNGIDRFLPTRRGAKSYAKQSDALAVGKGILKSLPRSVLDLRAEKA